jgi:mitochondrial fission protein ELM1
MEIFPHQQTPPGWLAGKLSALETVWVTEDSVSMIYEALSGGAKVGVLEMPRLRPGARVIRGLEVLRAEGYFDKDHPPQLLAEADRCAELILKESD